MRAGAIVLIGALLVACAPQTSATTPTASSPPLQPSIIAAGCGSTAVLHGGIPAWLDDAGGHNNPADLDYVIAHPPLAAGFLFTYPLQAGLGDQVPMKILWVVRTPRKGTSLIVDGHPLNASSPTVHEVRPDNSGPGEIYPDGVNVPSPGCWQFDLRWANSNVQVDLNYQ
ncbi:MAG TPA: hypothetical protein VFR68_09820 [Candidatus Dormibacteraeota bacterium]|nr:hypothetical protein [Candidatus Dormibacteraeota bacterium]